MNEQPGRLVRRVEAGLAALHATTPIVLVSLFSTCALFILYFVPWEQNGDDLLPTLIALQKLTPYFWAQNRFANLLPAITVWISDPTSNAFTQIVLRVVSGLIAPAFFAAAVFRRSIDVWRATLAANILFLASGSAALLHETFVTANPYGTSFGCAALSLLAFRRAWAWPYRDMQPLWGMAGGVMLLAAYAVNIGCILICLPFLGMTAILLPSAERMRLVVLHAAAACIGLLLPAVFAPGYATASGFDPSFAATSQFARAIWESSGWPELMALVVPADAVVLGYRFSRIRRPPPPFGAVWLAAAATALLAWLVLSASEHVRDNAFLPRYAVPCFIMLMALSGSSLWLALRLLVPARVSRDALFILLTIPLLLGVRTHLLVTGEPTTDLIGLGKAEMARTVAARYSAWSLDGIAGQFWDVWPSVFATEQLHHDVGWVGADVLGIAHRGAARRNTFLARMTVRGGLRVGCIDQTLEICLATAMDMMQTPGLRARPLATPERLGGEHSLTLIEILPPTLSPAP